MPGDATALDGLEAELGTVTEARTYQPADAELAAAERPRREPGFMTTVKATALVLVGCAAFYPIAVCIDDARAAERSRATRAEPTEATSKPAKPKGRYTVTTPRAVPVELLAGSVSL